MPCRVKKLAPQRLEIGKCYCGNTKKLAISDSSFDPLILLPISRMIVTAVKYVHLEVAHNSILDRNTNPENYNLKKILFQMFLQINK